MSICLIVCLYTVHIVPPGGQKRAVDPPGTTVPEIC